MSRSATGLPLSVRDDLVREEPPGTPVDRIHGKRIVRRKQILDLIRRNGPLPRVEIASRLGHNFRTVSELVDELIEEDLLYEDRTPSPPVESRGRNPVGRPPVPVCLNATAACAIGVEILRNHVAFVSMDLSGRILHRGRAVMPARAKKPEAAGAAFASLLGDFIRAHVTPLPPVAGIGLSFAGVFFKRVGEQHVLEPVPQAIFNATEALVGAPVLVHEHTAMLAFGEMWFDESEPKTFACVQICEGLGVALVEDGRLWYGHDGRAGDLGHLQLGQKGIPCFCGRDACLENTASSAGLERLAREAGLGTEDQPLSVDEVAQLARSGSGPAAKVWKDFGRALGDGLDALVILTNPEVILLGGTMSRYSDLFLDSATAQIESGAHTRYRRTTRVVVSHLHEDAVFVGACASVLQRIFGSSHDFIRSVV